MNTGKRILWIDYAKSICIYLVLLGHAHASQPVTDFIYTFHMPLFFFLSGCLFSFEKHPNFKEFAIKRFKGLMVPYLWINLITYLFWLFAGRNFGEDATISTTWYSPIIGILLGYSKQMIHNLSLFLGNILLPPIQTVTKEKQIDKDFGIDRYRRHRIHKLCLQSLHITLLFGNCHSRNGFLRNRQFNRTQHTNNKNKITPYNTRFPDNGNCYFHSS